ncbi:MAG TPA: hypothetical protein VLV78_08550 [Thermoanaerobaculia bacterium]|nr:hypothetical protein [Thermoanaerobaculia bacterium]
MRNPFRDSHRMNIIWPERRRARRYLTLKNAGLAGAGLIALSIVLSLWSQFRPHSGASGDLMQSAVRVRPYDSKPARHDLTIVDEGPITRQSETDSLPLDQGAEDQVPALEQTSLEHRTSQLGKGQRITISGGSEGVQLHAEPMPPAAAATAAVPIAH